MELNVEDFEGSEILTYKCACHSFNDTGEDAAISGKEWLIITLTIVARILTILCHFSEPSSHHVIERRPSGIPAHTW